MKEALDNGSVRLGTVESWSESVQSGCESGAQGNGGIYTQTKMYYRAAADAERGGLDTHIQVTTGL
jgi:hypothetical protein